ncbi:MAG: hypothetical protein HKN50_06690 [Gammaproteobacteria bacterium]|nr:hypothetical protein [Gammaproteobacteria bacterium]
MENKFIITLPSSLFPFRHDQLSHLQYRNYSMLNVFESITDEQREAVMRLWNRNGLLTDQDAAWQRSSEVCYFITETRTGQLIGVNTLYPGKIVASGPTLFLNRMFIDPQHRNSRLSIIATGMMLCFAKTALSDRGILGVGNVNENSKLSRPGMRKIFTRWGYQFKGTLSGQDVWRFDFDRISIQTN